MCLSLYERCLLTSHLRSSLKYYSVLYNRLKELNNEEKGDEFDVLRAELEQRLNTSVNVESQGYQS